MAGDKNTPSNNTENVAENCDFKQELNCLSVNIANSGFSPPKNVSRIITGKKKPNTPKIGKDKLIIKTKTTPTENNDSDSGSGSNKNKSREPNNSPVMVAQNNSVDYPKNEAARSDVVVRVENDIKDRFGGLAFQSFSVKQFT